MRAGALGLGVNHARFVRHARLCRATGAVAQQLESRVLLSSISLIQQISPTPFGYSVPPTNAANIGGELFFAATPQLISSYPHTGNELWKSDGTSAGTVLVKDINPDPNSSGSNPTDLVAVGNEVFFSATDGTDGTELWKTDGTAAGTVMVRDIVPGSGSSNPGNLTDVNGTLFFSATDAAGNASLWKSDGTAAGTVELATVAASELTIANGMLFFGGTDASHNTTLWKSDGTPAGTVPLPGVLTSTGDYQTTNLAAFDSELYFSGAIRQSDGSYLGGLCKTDGTVAGTLLVKQVGAWALYAIGNTLYFEGNDVTGGSNYEQLWKSDGTTLGTVQITRFNTYATDFGPAAYANLNGKLIIAGIHSPSQIDDPTVSLFTTDGTQAGTIELPSNLDFYQFPPSMLVANGLLYFVSYDATHPFQLFQTDGTIAGTVKCDPSETGQVSPTQILGQANNTLLFTATTSIGRSFGADYSLSWSLYGLTISPPPAPPATATLPAVDNTTEGSWKGVYGSQGYDLPDGRRACRVMLRSPPPTHRNGRGRIPPVIRGRFWTQVLPLRAMHPATLPSTVSAWT